MALERKDNIGDTTTSTGTGTINLAAVAQTGARIFAGNVTSGATVRYDIRSSDNTEWEIGEGVFTDGAPDTLTRVTVYASSNYNNLVNFSAGTKNVSMVITAKDVIGEVAPQNLLKNGNFINNSTNGYGSTPDDWVSSNANPVQGGIPALTKQNLIDGLGITDGNIEGLWNLNNVYTDLSSNGYALTASGSPVFSLDGQMAQAIDLESGSSQYASATAATCNITGSQTFFGFIKPESLVNGVVIGNSNASTYKFLRLLPDGTIQFRGDGLTTNTSVISDVLLQAGKWYMVVGIYDSANSKLKLWVNGIKKEVTASGSMSATNTTINVGCTGGTVTNYFDGLIQNACVLSVALTDNQVKKLFAMTMYKGQKIRRATTNAYQYQKLPQDLVEQLRGKTVALRADLYQEVASTAQISIHQTMADATTDETIISATDATTGSWLSKVATGTLEADVVTVEIRIKHSTTDGNSWFRNISLYEGSALLPYDHSKEDWSRFPRLLKMDIPAVISGYQFEEGKWFNYTPTISVSAGTAPTYTTTFFNRFLIREKLLNFVGTWDNQSGGTAGAGAAQLLSTTPAVISSNIIVQNRSSLGQAQLYESGGTIGAGFINGYTTTQIGFYLGTASSLTGNDQSSVSRFINFNCIAEID